MSEDQSDIYKSHWDIASCKAYAKQLRDKTRANTAEHAAEAIEYLLSVTEELEAMLERQTARIVDLQTHIETFDGEEHMNREDIIRMAREAGAVFPADGSYHTFVFEGSLERFADLVASAERERILDICKEGLWYAEGIRYHLDIRARGQA